MSFFLESFVKAKAICFAPVVQANKALVAENVATFHSFDKSANDLDHKLRLLGSSMQLMGFSVGVLNATYHLRQALMRLQFHVRKNVGNPVPRSIRLLTHIKRLSLQAAYLYERQVKPNANKYIHEYVSADCA